MSDPLRKPSDAVGDSSQHPPMTESGVNTPGLSRALRSMGWSLSGLTLVELLIGFAVVAVLFMLGYPYYIGIVVRARETAAVAHMSDWPKAQLLYWTDNGHFATSLTQLYDAGFLVPVDAERIGYSFEITQFTAAAPPRGRTMPAFAAAPVETWWEGIDLVKHAWANGKDKGEDDDDEEEKDNDGKGEDGNGEIDEGGADGGQGDSGGDDSGGTVADDSGSGTGDGEESSASSGDEQGGSGTGDGEESSASSGDEQGGSGIGWQGYADPTDERPRHFYMDQTNDVRFAIGRRATRYDPLVKTEDKDKSNSNSSGGNNNSGSNSGKGRGGL